MLAFRPSYFLNASSKIFMVFFIMIPSTAARNKMAPTKIRLSLALIQKHIAILQIKVSGARTAIRITI